MDTNAVKGYSGNMKIYLATGNKNKKREIQEIFPQHTIVTPADEGIDFDPEETGNTFLANSLIKARALWQITHCPVIADDSGICVDALDGRPGIYSSRYAGPEHPDNADGGKGVSQADKNRFLIAETDTAIENGLTKITDEAKSKGLFKNGPRSAHYTCAMVFLTDWFEYSATVQTMEGSIIERIEDARGTGGFGYDPIFLLPGQQKTAAELTDAEKNAISHRGKAARIIQKILEDSH